MNKRKYQVGDIVTGNSEADLYLGITNSSMLRGKIIKITKGALSKESKDDYTVTILIKEHLQNYFNGEIEELIEPRFLTLVSEKKKKKAPKGYVTGYNDEHIKKENARTHLGIIYEIDKSIFLINKTWYPITSPEIDFDFRINKYNLDYQLASGLVGLNKDGSLKFGKFSLNGKEPEAMLKRFDKEFEHTLVLDIDTAKLCGLTECYNSGYFYKGKSQYIKKVPFHTKFDNTRKKGLGKKEDYFYGTQSPLNRITEGKPYSFGIELETINGRVPAHAYMDKLNMRCVYDGSCTGGEYVSGPLKGDLGFVQVHKMCHEISKRCDIDKTCSLHVHIGGAIFNKEFTVYAWILGKKIENEIFKCVAASRKGSRFCQPLPHANLPVLKANFDNVNKETYNNFINEAYGKIFTFLSGGILPSMKVNKEKHNPNGRYCASRYYWLNLVCCNFIRGSNDGYPAPENYDEYTVEFRNHSATLNSIKVKYWILICMGIVWFVENQKKHILEKNEISLSYIMKKAYPKTGKKLANYIEQRIEKLANKNEEAVEYSQEENITELKQLKGIIEE